MKKASKFFASALAFSMCLGLLAGCGSSDKPAESGAASGSDAAETQSAGESTSGGETPLVVGYAPFSSKFSPFFAETAYDQDASTMTQLSLLTSDRTGAIVNNGIEGETREYNGTDYTYYGPADLVVTENADGTVFYDFTLRDDLTFSDGEPITIDDVIFSMYVLCDPTYDGSSTLYAQPISGMGAYRQGMTAKYELILADGPDGSKDGSKDGYYTADEAAAFWTAFDKAGEAFAQEIVDYMTNNYGAASVKEAAAGWGYEGLADDATAADFFKVMLDNYGYDISDAGLNAESAGTSMTSFLTENMDETLAAGVKTGDSADNIAGIQKTGDYSMRVVTDKVDATTIYQLTLNIAPLHYYGEKDLYDYDNNKFGFTKGDLSHVRSVTTKPLGAGPYKFIKFENGVINFEANESYFQGVPKTKYINFLETQDSDKLNGVVTGTIDITDPSWSNDAVAAVTQANGGEVSGKVITVNSVDNLGYGYVGMNSNNVCVNGEPGSDASKNLRKALATVISVYRNVSVDSYYGERAAVINYPISNTSWAAPQPTDDGYQVAFSVDVDGNPIYTSSMSDEEKYDAALNAALGFFEAAGYTVTDGKVTEAPKGASLEYEVLIPADGAGDHPSFMMLTLAHDALAKIGINLIVTDLSNSSDLWEGLDAGTVAMWAAAWQATVDPDMYQIYYYEGPDGKNNGGSASHYCIWDDDLNKMIMDARATTDQTYRKAMYKACLDIIIDWACEIPVYQRQNCVIFSTERVNIDTITKDITPFYGWMAEVQDIELN